MTRQSVSLAASRNRFVALAMAFLTTNQALGQPADQPANDAKFVAPFCHDSTFLIARIDGERISIPRVTEKTFGSLSAEERSFLAVAMQAVDRAAVVLRILSCGKAVYATAAIPLSENQTPIQFFRERTADSILEEAAENMAARLGGKVLTHDKYLVAVPGDGRLVAADVRPESQAVIASAFASQAGLPVQLLLIPPDHVWRTIRELSPTLPSQLGGGPSQRITDIRWISLGIEPTEMRFRIIVQTSSHESAKAFAAHLPVMLGSLDKATASDRRKISAKLAKDVIRALEPTVESDRVHIRVAGLAKYVASIGLAYNAIDVVTAKSAATRTVNNFRQILVGIHNFNDVHKTLPPGDDHRDANGRPFLSWRVHLLPYLEQRELYEQFRLDEPWNSPHNKRLIAKMPAVYGKPATGSEEDRLQPGYTTVLAPVGKGTIFGQAKATRLGDITDGTSQTIALVQVVDQRAVLWTKPDDYTFDPKKPLSGIAIGKDGVWTSGYADGSVHRLPGDVSAKDVRNLFQMNDGNPVNVN